MEFTAKQLKMATRLSYGANLFQGFFFRDPLFRKQFDDSFKALFCFIEHYAYQRQGAPTKTYAEIGKMAINQVLNENMVSITKNNVEEVWEKCQEVARREFNGIDLNARNNPLNSNGGVLELLATGTIANNNLALHVRYLFENGKTKDAHQLMDGIRGVAVKIASLYLRDIAYLARIPEDRMKDPHYLQPIDTWLNQALTILFGCNVPKRLEEKQKIIVNLCTKADVSPVAFNQGAWVLGSQIAGDFRTFKRIAEGKEVKSIIEEYIKEEKNYVNEVERFLQDWPEL